MANKLTPADHNTVLSLLKDWEYYTTQQTSKVHHIPVKLLIALKHEGDNMYMCETILYMHDYNCH